MPFIDPLGFRFFKSSLRLSKKDEGITKIIHSLNKYNSENDCTFWTMWSTQSTRYGKWYERTWGQKPPNIALGSISDWNIPGWSRGAGEHFHLKGTRADDQEIANLIQDTQAYGLPYLQNMSDYKNAAERFVEERWMYDKATDLLMMIVMDECRITNFQMSPIRACSRTNQRLRLWFAADAGVIRHKKSVTRTSRRRINLEKASYPNVSNT